VGQITGWLPERRHSALICAGDKSFATCTGTSVNPSCFAPCQRKCPITISSFRSATMGWRNPNSRMDAAIFSTAACDQRRAFFAYSFSRSIGHISMVSAAAAGGGVLVICLFVFASCSNLGFL
jgi:hypothetical protein